MSHLLFHRLFVFHHSRCDPALSVFASKCQGERYAWTAALCDLGDPGWGDPWFPHWALLLLSPSYLAPLCVSVFSLFCFLFGGHSHNDTQDVIMHVIPIAGCDPTSLCCVCFGLVVVVCFLFSCFLLFLVGFFVWFLAGTARWTAYRSTSSTFVAIEKWQPCMWITIHLFAAIECV